MQQTCYPLGEAQSVWLLWRSTCAAQDAARVVQSCVAKEEVSSVLVLHASKEV